MQTLNKSKLDQLTLRANSKQKNEGGKGADGLLILDGTVLTVRENAALAIAKDVLDDARRHHGRNPASLPLTELARFAAGRTEGKPCTDGQVLAEIGRLVNHALYGDKVIRRSAH